MLILKITMFLVWIFLLPLSFAQHFPESAYRELETPFEHYLQKATSLLRNTSTSGSPLSRARHYSTEPLPNVTAWLSQNMMQERFNRIRDERFLSWKRNPEIIRRSSWKYPDDGCYVRAALAVRNVFRWFQPLPNKIFVFGNLRVKTNNSPRGVVGWWYHVAPIVQVAGEKYVLDPAIEETGPLLLHDWLSRMGDPSKMKVAICDSGTYSPSDSCTKITNGLELTAERSQQYYLDLEYNRLRSMGREGEL